jgi:hypothetical protein
MISANCISLNSDNARGESHTIDFLKKTKENLNDFLQFPKRFLKKLQTLNIKRGKRIERIEAITKVSKLLIDYVELNTLQIGLFKHNGDFVSLCDIKYIAKQTGLNYIRVRRALKDLIKAGYLLVKRHWVKDENGKYRGIASIKQFSTSFFTDLKQEYDKLVRLRNWKIKRMDKQALKEQRKQGSSFLGGLLSPLLRRNKKKVAPTIPDNIQDEIVRKRKAYCAEVLRLHQLRPDIPLFEIKDRLAPMLE